VRLTNRARLPADPLARLFLVSEIKPVFRLTEGTICRHIRTGRLRAVNISPLGDGSRPVYRTWESDLRDWVRHDPGALAHLDAWLADPDASRPASPWPTTAPATRPSPGS
jgi:hypothetical protein